MFQRHLRPQILDALSDTPVVLLHGARQAGKSTLAQEIAAGPHPARYLTFDDTPALAAAKADPAGFIAGLESPVVLDEVQRVPELFTPIKAVVDRSRRPGQFLLTGSANVLFLPRLSESLAGRMEVLTLWPLSQGEIVGATTNLVDWAFTAARPPAAPPETREALAGRIAAGGYPEAVQRPPARRPAWFRSYITTILQRTVRDIADIDRVHELPRLLSVLAARTGTLLNIADLSRTLAIPQTTLQRYVALLQSAFLVYLVPAWTARVRRRFLKAPKIIFVDTGLAANLVGLDARALGAHQEVWGAFVETFAVVELLKQAGWSTARPALHHLRTAKGEEVDLVLETPSGDVVGIEVKAAVSVVEGDFRGLRILADAAGRRFVRGLLLYAGAEVVPFGPNLHAVPLSSLWRDARART